MSAEDRSWRDIQASFLHLNLRDIRQIDSLSQRLIGIAFPGMMDEAMSDIRATTAVEGKGRKYQSCAFSWFCFFVTVTNDHTIVKFQHIVNT